MKRQIAVTTLIAGVLVVAVGIAHADITGFGGNGVAWTVNQGAGGTPFIASDVLTLTVNTGDNHNSAFFNTRQPIGSFTATFIYQAGGARGADGVAFVLQNSTAGPSAVGTGDGGSGLGYFVIAPSAAVELNIFSDPGTGYYTGGCTGHLCGPSYIPTSPVCLPCGNPIAVTLHYDGTALTQTLVDTIDGSTFTHTYIVNIPGDVSGSTAFVGFTGGTGGATSIQTISNFRFVTSPTRMDPVADFDAGFAGGTNPNGVWTYGWSSALTSPLIVYPRHRTISPDCAPNPYNVWDDPGNNVSFTPSILKNVGATCADGNVDVPSQALDLHFGGASGSSYSHIVFTAPSDGTYAVSWTFTGHQNNVNSDVHILVNGHSVLSDLITVNRQTKSFAGSVALLVGQRIDFAVGPGSVINLHPGHIGISGSIEKIVAPGTPSALSASLTGDRRVTLAWTPNGSSATGFQIDRRTVAGFVRIATVAGNVQTFTDTRVTPQHVYTYRVRAVNGAGVSGSSNEATVSLLVGKLVVRQRNLVVNVPPGTIGTAQLQLRNAGRAMLDGSVGALSAPFAVTAGGGVFSLPPGATLTVTVRFAPTTRGSVTETLTITSLAPSDPPVTVVVTGNAR